MTIWNHLARWAGKGRARHVPSRSAMGALAPFLSAAPPPSYEALAREGYARNPVARRAVRLLAEGAASVRWVALNHGQRQDQHPALALLAEPNPNQSGASFFETLVSWLELHGNAYVELVEGAQGQPAELYALRPERVSVVVGATGWPSAYRYAVGSTAVTYSVDPASGRSELLHLKSFHPLDDHYGLGGLQAAADAIAVHNAAATWNKALLSNAARPSGALVYQGSDAWPTLSADQFERLKTELAGHFSGADNAGRPLLLEGGLSWQPLSLSPADMDFVQSKHAAARDIALAFGVPPMLLGIPGDNSYANYQEANRALWRLTLLPMLARLAGALSVWLRPYWPGLTLEVDRDAIPALSYDREQLWRQVSQTDVLSRAEKRQLLGFPGEVSPPGTAQQESMTENFTD